MIIFVFQTFDMIETRFHVILGNVKCDWPGFVGFLQLWYWRETSFPKDGAGTRQANDIVWLQNWKYPWIKLCDEIIIIFVPGLVYSGFPQNPSLLDFGQATSHLQALFFLPVEWEGWWGALRPFPLVLNFTYSEPQAALRSSLWMAEVCSFKRDGSCA